MNNRDKRITAIELVVIGIVVLLVVLFVSRLFWGAEVSAIEGRALETVGLGGWKKFLVILLLSVWYFVSLYSREAQTAKEAGRPVVRRSIAALSIMLLVFAVVFAFATA